MSPITNKSNYLNLKFLHIYTSDSFTLIQTIFHPHFPFLGLGLFHPFEYGARRVRDTVQNYYHRNKRVQEVYLLGNMSLLNISDEP